MPLQGIPAIMAARGSTGSTLLNGLVSYWKLDAATDIDRVDSHGSNTLVTHGVASSPNAILVKAGAFQAGALDYLSLATNASVEFTTAFSIQLWVTTDTSFAPSATFASKWLYATDGSWSFTMDGAGSQLRMWVADSSTDAGGNIIDSTGASFSAGPYFHIVMVYDGSQSTASDRVKFYVNASLLGVSMTGTIASSLLNSAEAFNIGYWPGLGRYWDGTFDEIGLWNRVLTSGEVSQLYNSGAALAYPFS